jgi:hypothetical protein
MPGSKEHITLYGDKAALFRDIRDELEDEYGYRPPEPEVVGRLMAEFDD